MPTMPPPFRLDLLAFFLWICLCIGFAKGRSAGGTARRAASARDVGPYKVPSGPKSFCSPCDIRTCPQITPEMCRGKLVKDDCGCCPQCDLTQPAASSTVGTSEYDFILYFKFNFQYYFHTQI